MTRLKLERPSCCSKHVLHTQSRNKLELQLLEENLKKIDRERMKKKELHLESIKRLHEVFTAIQTVKTRVTISRERREFLSSQGFTIKDREVNMVDLVNSTCETNLISTSKSQILTSSAVKKPLLRLDEILLKNRKDGKIFRNKYTERVYGNDKQLLHLKDKKYVKCIIKE